MDTYDRIYQQVRRIPSGKVASYGSVAMAAGLFRGARLVGWALKALPEYNDVPWQRVINKQGVLSIVNPNVPKAYQKELLEQEGVAVEGEEGNFYVPDPPWHDFV